jgi:hypothetical protein
MQLEIVDVAAEGAQNAIAVQSRRRSTDVAHRSEP